MQSTARLRTITLLICTYLLLATGIWVLATEPYFSLRVASLTQKFGYEGIFFLYLAILISPLSEILPRSFRAQLIIVRRPLGVAAFFASVLHTGIGFWGELGGFSGVPFLTTEYKISLALTALALLILLALAVTSFDKVITFLGSARWKWLHRFVYLSAYLIVLHVLKLGSDYSSTTPALRVGFVLLSFLLILEALRIDRYLQKTQFRPIGFGVISLIVAGFIALQLGAIGSGKSLSLHASHDAATPTPLPSAHIHYHANFLVYINGISYDFSQPTYLEPVSICSLNPEHPAPQARVHLHEGDGTLVHVHSANVTWGDLFSNLGFAINASSIVSDEGVVQVVDPNHNLFVILNGEIIKNIAPKYIGPNDRLLIDYGSASMAEAQTHFAKVPATAAAASEHTDPATCSGS